MDNSKLLWGLIKNERYRYAGALLATMLAAALTFSVPLVAQFAIDTLLDAPSQSMTAALGALLPADPSALLPVAATIAVALTAMAGVFQYLRNRWTATAAENIARGLRDGLYHHLQRLPVAFHDDADSGDLIQRCTSDVETLREFLDSHVVDIGRTLILVLMATPVLLMLDASLAVISLILLPAVFACAYVFFRKIQVQFRLADEADARMTTVLQENLTGIRVVRAFARQEFEREKFGGANASHRNLHQRSIQLLGLYYSSSDLLCHGQIGLTLICGAQRVLAGELSVGTLFVFLSYLGLVVWPVKQLGRVLTETGKTTVSHQRLRGILDRPVESDQPMSAVEQPLAGAIEFVGVRFGFSERPVLNGLSLRVAPGQTAALIGAARRRQINRRRAAAALVRLPARFDTARRP